MRILVTGGCGFIGSSVVRRLLADGHQVLNLDKLTYAANPASLAGVEGKYALMRGDVASSADVRNAFMLIRPEAVIHLAAETQARTIADVYRVLDSGRHPFNSMSVDSLTEGQQRVIDDKVGTKKVERDDWGHLLRTMGLLVRQHRDLLIHPVRPLWSVTFVAGTHLRDGKWRPLVQGQLQDYLPYYVDIEGYLNANPDNSRDLLIGPHPQYETGERVGGRLPYALRVAYPGRFDGWTIESMLQQVLSA